MTGSTLYRRLPDGSWAAEREDVYARAAAPIAQPVPGSAGAASAGSGAPPAAPPRRSQPPQAPPPAGRRRRIRPLRILLVAVLAYAVWMLGLGVYASRSIQHVDAMPAEQIGDTDGRVWLLVGSDSRDGLTKEERNALHTGSEVGQRTDTIMLLHLKTGEDPTLISVPRDSWVTIPAHTASDGSQVTARKQKINAAYSFGGAPLLIETIEYNTGLHVDNYMEIGFSGIVTLTDAVNGIEVCFDKAINDKKSGLDVSKGCQTLDGEQALAWVRMRYADPKGDLGRMERQQQYVAKVIHEAADWRTLVNPFRQVALVDAATAAFVVDEDSGVVDLGRLGWGMAKVSKGSAEVTTVPTNESDHWENGQWVLKWDIPEANELFGSLGASTPQAQQD